MSFRFVATAFLFAATFALPARAAEKRIDGITQPYLDVIVSAPVQGIVNVAPCQEGDEVKEGQVILELDNKLEELEVARRKAVMEFNRTDLDATDALVKKTKAVSKEELQKKTMEYNVAVAEHGIAEEQLRRRRIIAPFAGSVMEIFLQPGASCEPYQPLVRLVDTKRCYFVGYLDAGTVANTKVGQTVKVEVAGQSVPASIAFIAPVVDSASGLTKVKALVENANGAIRPGVAARLLVE
jgi:RND family efflux transporter MFP subunit